MEIKLKVSGSFSPEQRRICSAEMEQWNQTHPKDFEGKNCQKYVKILLNPKDLNRAWKRDLGAENSETKERGKCKVFLWLTARGTVDFGILFLGKTGRGFRAIPFPQELWDQTGSQQSQRDQEFPPKAQTSSGSFLRKSRRKSTKNQRKHLKMWTKKSRIFVFLS